MKKIIYIVLFCVLLIGCKSTKQTTKTDIKTTDIAKIDTHEESTTNTSTATVQEDKSVASVTENEIEVGTRTKWSKPDSLGNQYPLETEGYIRGNNITSHIATESKKTDNAVIESDKTKTDKSDYKSDADVQLKDKKQEESKSPAWMNWGSVALIVGLFIFIYLLLKKYKIL